MNAMYVADHQELASMREIAKRLQGGSDRERDEGHKLALLLARMVMVPNMLAIAELVEADVEYDAAKAAQAGLGTSMSRFKSPARREAQTAALVRLGKARTRREVALAAVVKP